MAASKLFIVVRHGSDGSVSVCANGPKPFIGNKQSAKDIADFLKSVNPTETYVLYTATPTVVKGGVVEKYSGKETSNESKGSRKRVKQGNQVRA